MIIQSPGEVAFYIINFPIYWYGIFLAVAVFFGVCIAEILAERYTNIRKDFFIDIAPLIIILGIIGARLYYCALNYSYYSKHFWEIFDIRQGGLSVHGMLIAGILTVFYVVKKNNLEFLKVLDVLACATVFAQSVGRWGNFFNSEAFGLPTYSDWGLFIPVASRPVEYLQYSLFHPTFLYEAFADILIFFVLIFILSKAKNSGVTFFAYLVLYSFARILIEFVRVDSVFYLFGLPIAVVVSALFIFVGLSGIFYILKAK